jgi:hypothetical protein
MDPPPNISLSSDIGVLFTPNLKLKNDPRLVEQKLRQNGINTLEVLLNLTVSDLLGIGIDGSDTETLINQARYYFLHIFLITSNFLIGLSLRFDL